MIAYLQQHSISRFLRGIAAIACKGLLGAVFVLSLASCASPLPKGQVSDISISELQSGTAEIGLAVRWGGTIVSVHNKPDITVLEIVSRPLWRTGQPAHNDESYGRFVAEVSGFVDPELLSEGSDISLVGTVQELRSGTIGDASYQFPVMAVFQYKLWKRRKDFTTDDFAHKHFFDRYWNDWPYDSHANGNSHGHTHGKF